MKKIAQLSLFLALLFPLLINCRPEKKPLWQMAGNPLYTRWSKEVTPDNVWQEYPRPQFIRKQWVNLNGLWDFALLPNDSIPESFAGKILVPFPVESALSGVKRHPGADSTSWYQRGFIIPPGWEGQTIRLNFEGSDWETRVWVNGEPAGMHRGGYNPFSFDITPFISIDEPNTLQVSVWDPTNEGFQPRGKQVNKPRGIFYTPSSGIWQTVWMEPVGPACINDLKIFTDIDNSTVEFRLKLQGTDPQQEIQVQVVEGRSTLVSGRFSPGEKMMLTLTDPVLWSPENPHLYDVVFRFYEGDRLLDEVSSYFGMRKIALQKDGEGFVRLALNNKILFHNGPLDQGFWPDGLNTPPGDDAMKYDIEVTKAMGFNMLRKHVKVENRRFYTWCDRLGIMVWQDMPNAAGFIGGDDPDLAPSQEHRQQFEYELDQMIHTHFNHPSIVMWVPFNEGWGQYNTAEIAERVKALDPTRLVNNASGWTDRGAGDVIDIHHYPEPRCPDPEVNRASVLGEFGGLGLYLEGHTWQKENWGYEKLQETDLLLLRYEDFYGDVFEMNKTSGLAAVVYTQTTDVETETNGLLTYDREVVKMGVENIRKAHAGHIPPRLASSFRLFVDSIDVELVAPDPAASIQYSKKGIDDFAAYEGSLRLDTAATLLARCTWPDGDQSRVMTYRFEKAFPAPAMAVSALPGLQVHAYAGNWDSLPDFQQLDPVKQGLTDKIDLAFWEQESLFGLRFQAYLDVPVTGVYLFYLSSDDGAIFYLDDGVCIDYDGIHGPGMRKAEVALEKGLHPVRLDYFQRTGGLGLKLAWEGPGISYQEIGKAYWKH